MYKLVFMLLSFLPAILKAQCTPASIPTVGYSVDTTISCQQGDLTLFIVSGNLNDDSAWHWYPNACGNGTVRIGDTIKGVYTLSSGNQNYFVRGEGNCSNTNSCERLFVVGLDTLPPIPDVDPLPPIVGQCQAGAFNSSNWPTGTDDCPSTVYAIPFGSVQKYTQGVDTIYWYLTDDNNNYTLQKQLLIVDDTTAPIPNVSPLPDVYASCQVSLTIPTAYDSCTGTAYATTPDSTSFNTQGVRFINWYYDDGRGNLDSQIQKVVILDTIPPVPINLSLPSVFGACQASATTPIAIDNCSDTVLATTIDSVSFTTQGTRTITWVYTDNYGNTFQQTQQVVVMDTLAPQPLIDPLPLAFAECSLVLTPPKSVDNCQDTVIATTNDSTSFFTKGMRTVTWNYDDGYGNIRQQMQQVVIFDSVGPQPLVDSFPDVVGACSASVYPTMAMDSCTGLVMATTQDSTSFNTQGTRYVLWEFRDSSGNVTLRSQKVVVKDSIPPVIICPNHKTHSIVRPSQTVVVNNIDAVYTDNCSPITLSYRLFGSTNYNGLGQASGLSFLLGITTVEYTVKDVGKNSSNCSFQITVVDPFTGIAESEISTDLKIYPNPTSDRIFVEAENQEIESLTLYNSIGAIVLEKNGLSSAFEELDVSGLPHGVYYLGVGIENKLTYKKILIK